MPPRLNPLRFPTRLRRIVIWLSARTRTGARVRNGLRVFRLALGGAYPNPFVRTLRIRFNLPESGVDAVRFAIVGITGRVVWEKTLPCAGGISGSRELSWDGKTAGGSQVGAGLYVLRMTAEDAKGKTTGVFEKKITAMP